MESIMEKKIVVYLAEEFADWEGAFLLPELAQHKISYVIASENGQSISSIGKLKVQPDASLNDIKPDDIRALILIGADSWPDASKNQKALQLAGELIKKDILVAGICSATVALTKAGHTRGYKHTSNSLRMLKYFAPDYTDEQNYVDQLAVRDRNLITATGNAPVEFAFELIKVLDIYKGQKLDQWYQMCKNGVMPPDDFWS